MSVRGFNTGSGIEQYDYDYLDNKPAAPTKESIGLGNVDNTSDMDKPVSTLQEQALSQKVDKVPGMGLSSEDYTSAEKEKLGDLPTNTELEAALDGKASAESVAALESAVNDPDNGLDTKAPAITNTASGAIASFSDGADGMPVKKLVVAVEPVQEGTGDPSPDNIRPISGWTGAEIEGTGVNVWDEVAEIGSINPANGQNISSTARIRSINYIPVKPDETYYFNVGNDSSVFMVLWYGVDKSYIRKDDFAVGHTITVPHNAYYLRFASSPQYGSTYNHDISINYPATDTAYHAYNGNQISVTFPTSAGTVYGATLTVNPDRTGQLVVDRADVDMGTLDWSYNGERFQASRNSITTKPTRLKGISDIYPVYNGTVSSAPDKSLIFSDTSTLLYVKDSAFTDAAEFKAGMSGHSIVYLLANPITYTLTPEEVSGILTTFYGTNNIWADCGDSTVEYTADTKLFIEQLTQPTEDDMTADHAISSGTFFMIGNNLYLATSQIAAGATITPGTNATKLSLADALNQLNA